LVAVVSAGFTLLIYSGIRSRLDAEKRLEVDVKTNAVPAVTVIHPQAGSTAQAIELPGTARDGEKIR
jgi:hypothetical protein